MDEALFRYYERHMHHDDHYRARYEDELRRRLQIRQQEEEQQWEQDRVNVLQLYFRKPKNREARSGMPGNAIAPYRPPAPTISKSLLKKNELTLRERMWVWNDVVGGAVSLSTIVIGLAWYSVLWPQVTGAVLMLLGILGLITSGTLFYYRRSSDKSALGGSHRGYLNHTERAKLCLYDRNRRARPHRNDYRFANKRYSVWPEYGDFTGSGKQATLLMLQHTRPRPYLITYILPRRFRFSQRAWFVEITPGDSGIQMIGAPGSRPSSEELHEAMDDMERMASALEAKPHVEKLKEYDAEEAMLDLRRRPPKASQAAVKVVRKQLMK